MGRIVITLLAAVVNQHVFDYIKFVFIDAATISGSKQKKALIKASSTFTGIMIWFLVRSRIEESTISIDDVFFATTTGLCSNLLHDVNGIAKQTAIATKKRITKTP
jgi:hypothetical protein